MTGTLRPGEKLRVEFLRGRYGAGPEAKLLGPAYYNLVCKRGEDGPACHSFCMCPGGKIVACVNEVLAQRN